MILKQVLTFLATYLLRERFSPARTNWIGDSTKAIGYTALTTMVLVKLNALLKKSVIVIPLTVLGTVLVIVSYMDLMNIVDNGVEKLEPSFFINLVIAVVCFAVSVYVLHYVKDKHQETSETELTDSDTDPIQSAKFHVQENLEAFKRGFSQGYEKSND